MFARDRLLSKPNGVINIITILSPFLTYNQKEDIKETDTGLPEAFQSC